MLKTSHRVVRHLPATWVVCDRGKSVAVGGKSASNWVEIFLVANKSMDPLFAADIPNKSPIEIISLPWIWNNLNTYTKYALKDFF